MRKIRTFVTKTLAVALAAAALLTTTVAAAEAGSGTITASALRVRERATTDSAVLTLIPNGTQVELLGEEGDWYYTSYSGFMGYISKEYVAVSSSISTEASATAEAPAPAVSTQAVKQEVVDTSCTYIGTPYVYGGASPSGFDCSGFTLYIYELFGYSLPHSATAQLSYGTQVDKDALQMGDLVFFLDSRYASSGASHVGLYIGGGNFIHAPNPSEHVTIDTLLSGYWGRTYTTARRLSQG